MDLGLRDRVVMVTGGSRGIGRAIAEGFAREGARLVLCARTASTLDDAAAALKAGGARVCAVVADVTEEAGRTALVEAAHAAFGPVEVLVHNVGGGGAATFDETSREVWDEALEWNLRAPIELTRRVLPDMRAAGRGCVLFISSVFGREWGGRPAYMTAKAAEIALAKSMARELAPSGIRVNSVAPGSILFPGGSWAKRLEADPERIGAFVKSELPLGRFGTPEEVADVAVFLASDRASLVTGACVAVDGCQSRSLI